MLYYIIILATLLGAVQDLMLQYIFDHCHLKYPYIYTLCTFFFLGWITHIVHKPFYEREIIPKVVTHRSTLLHIAVYSSAILSIAIVPVCIRAVNVSIYESVNGLSPIFVLAIQYYITRITISRNDIIYSIILCIAILFSVPYTNSESNSPLFIFGIIISIVSTICSSLFVVLLSVIAPTENLIIEMCTIASFIFLFLSCIFDIYDLVLMESSMTTLIAVLCSSLLLAIHIYCILHIIPKVKPYYIGIMDISQMILVQIIALSTMESIRDEYSIINITFACISVLCIYKIV
jgi:drug/metabolite transporter (DMT)-like permease